LVIIVLYALDSSLASLSNDGLVGERVNDGVSGHGRQSENNVAEKQDMMGRQEQEMMGRDVLSGASFIGAAGDMVTIHFPKKCAFLFQPPAQSGHRIEEPKG
jgi:hypothetical protein